MWKRRLLALMVLVCGAAGADAAKKTENPTQPSETWCSDGFDKPTELLITAGPNFVLKTDGSADETLDIEKDTIYPATLRNLSKKKGSPPKEYQVWIVRDRLFWPCDG